MIPYCRECRSVSSDCACPASVRFGERNHPLLDDRAKLERIKESVRDTIATLEPCKECGARSTFTTHNLTAEGQPQIVRPHDPTTTIRSTSDKVRMRILRVLCDNAEWSAFVALADERATSIGAAEYGDESYHKTDDDLEYEGACEIADLIFYFAVLEERQP